MKYLSVAIGLLGYASASLASNTCLDPQRISVRYSKDNYYSIFLDNGEAARVGMSGWAHLSHILDQAKTKDVLICINFEKAPNGVFSSFAQVESAFSLQPIQEADRKGLEESRKKRKEMLEAREKSEKERLAARDRQIEAAEKAKHERQEALTKEQQEKFDILSRIEITIGNDDLLLKKKPSIIPFSSSIFYQVSIPIGNSSEQMQANISRTEYTCLLAIKTEAQNKAKSVVVKTVLLDQWIAKSDRTIEELSKLVYVKPDVEE